MHFLWSATPRLKQCILGFIWYANLPLIGRWEVRQHKICASLAEELRSIFWHSSRVRPPDPRSEASYIL